MYTIGVDVGGTKAHFVLVKDGRMVQERTMKTPRDLEYNKMLSLFDSHGIEPMVEKEGISYNDIYAIGWGVPGTVDEDARQIIECPNLPEFNRTYFQRDMEEVTLRQKPIPNYVDNDANCFAVGAYRQLGLERKYRHAVGVITGTGVGAGIIINRSLHSGLHTSAGEIGKVELHGGKTIEDLCSGRALNVDIDGTRIDGAGLYELIQRGNGKAQRVGRKFVAGNIVDLVNAVVDFYNPEAIIFGGSVSNITEFYRQELQAALHHTLQKKVPALYFCKDHSVNALGASYLHEGQGTKTLVPSIPLPVKEAREEIAKEVV